ncbi:hypothetical protein [Streptococcus danieliae]|uniref:hypothetical protein n=1 Tax=Streptococcus danieliae TaxID=747656 RepID=UPI0013661D4C|nr:hypothetical protein [Streptococcus danieliae]
MLKLKKKRARRILLDRDRFTDVREGITDISRNTLDRDLVEWQNSITDSSKIILGINLDLLDVTELSNICRNIIDSFIYKDRVGSSNNEEVVVVILLMFPNERIIPCMKELKYVFSQMEIVLDRFKQEQFQIEVDFRVNSLIPMFRIENESFEPWMRRLQIRQPLNRYVTAEDIANTLYFLLSEESKAGVSRILCKLQSRV